MASLEELEDMIVESIEEFADQFIEGRQRTIVVRGGKRKVKYKATGSNQKIVGGKATHMGAAERIRRQRSQKRAAIKRKAKQAKVNKKRKKSMKKRHMYGLDV